MRGFHHAALMPVMMCIITFGTIIHFGRDGKSLPVAAEHVHGVNNAHGRTTQGQESAVRVLFGASGSNRGFIEELEVALKSILLNAPIDLPLEIHYIADKNAFSGIKDMLDRIEIRKWRMRNHLSFHIYNVQSYIKNWTRSVDDVWNQMNPNQPHFRHSIGAYFRLFAHNVLPESVTHALYMDSDVVIMANLQELWRHVDPTSKQVFQWGVGAQCSGFVVINVKRLPELWGRISTLKLPSTGIFGDQKILRHFNKSYPNLVGVLPREWDITAKNGFRACRSCAYTKATPEEVQQDLQKCGMLHFNGGGESTTAYFESHPLLNGGYHTTFGLAQYYVDLTWGWTRFMVESKRKDDDTFHLPTVETI